MDKAKESTQPKILVLGGMGKTGSRVVGQLSKQGIPARVGSRSADLPFDWLNESTWSPILDGIKAVYISFQPDLAVPGAVQTIQSFTQTAVAQGVQHLVLLSGRGEPEAQACEAIITQSGVDWTILRSSWFSQNFSEGYLLEPILAGYVALPVANIGEPFIDIDDLAEVAVAALTRSGHRQKLYELTGPRLLSFAEAVGEIARLTGRSIHYEQIPIEVYAAELSENGVPQEAIDLLRYLFTQVMDGRNASLTTDLEQALNRKPTDFTEFVRKSMARGLWDQTLVGDEAGANGSSDINVSKP